MFVYVDKNMSNNEKMLKVENVENDQNKITFEDVEIDKKGPAVNYVFSNQSLHKLKNENNDEDMSWSVTNQNEKRVKDLETFKNSSPVISDVFSYKTKKIILNGTVKGIKKIENCEYIPAKIISVYANKNKISSVNYVNVNKKKSIISVNDSNQNISTDGNCTNIKIEYQRKKAKGILHMNAVNSKNTDQDSFISIKPPKIKTDSLEIGKKLHNFICQRIKKKQRLNTICKKIDMEKKRLYETSGFNNALFFNSENKTKSSNNENSLVDLYSSESTDIEDLSTMDEDKYRTFGSIGNLNTNKQRNQIKNIHNLDPNCAGPLQFHRTLKTVDNIYYKKVPPSDLNKVRPFTGNSTNKNCTIESISNCEMTLDDNILSNFQEYVQSTSNNNSKQPKFRQRYELFPNSHKLTTDDKLKGILHSVCKDEDNIDDDKLYTLDFELDKPFKELYTQLLDEFEDETQLLNHLMKNEEMLYNKKLVLSETADKETRDYVNQHLDSSYQIFGEHK